MLRAFQLLNGITGRITTRLVVIVSISILITATLGYVKLYEVTATNSAVRIDRAARAATALFAEQLNNEFVEIHAPDGAPLALRLKADTADVSLSFRTQHDALLKDIGQINQGAANLFKFNPHTRAFDRFATTFRKPDGSMPPPMSIKAGHPAYEDLNNNRPHLGEVPVMGRMRLAYLTPIQTSLGAVAGALAVDVGWVDDLIAARDELRTQVTIAAGLVLVLVAALGACFMSTELKPLRVLAKLADDLVAAGPSGTVPYMERNDEVGALAQGLDRVVTLQGKLAQLAYSDDLTGLSNRCRHLNELEAALRESHSGAGKWTLAHLDIDNFKQINDAYGQTTGDDLLKLAAAQIKDVFGPDVLAARLTSDHFVVLIGGDNSASRACALTEKLLDGWRQPHQLPAGEIHITGSAGIVLLHQDAEDADQANRNAELALRKAKASGGDQAVFFTSDLNDAFQEQIQMERLLRSAIEAREIEIYFQPQINPTSRALTGLEVLARWTHPNEGPISPARFIPVAEASGQIVELGTLILDLACEQAAKWRRMQFEFKHISVNVSPIQLWQSNFVGLVKETLARHGLSGHDLCIEITESVFVDHSEHRIAAVLSAIRALGVSLSLDDFGSGYSSLGYLNRLPFDQLKIDRSFVSDADTDYRKQRVLRGVLELGRGLGFNLVVEGTETLEEVKVATSTGCDSVQGFYFARPAPALLIPELVNRIARTRPAPKAIPA
ncbi:EAL domain-containing protein [Hoeflea sp. G2-23]|uniref:EAL domain-containing protein n=1 Tax=Hoeflea algicola TaxID=2983763 RepID=A0ABT3ZCJ7_9HYPH|nr:EAL domain-containing protein [Hoeflea algicola]MCY0149535.1 EAL domain-containing protein [Hoeflea algicola]